MLLRFSVVNFGSIRDRQELSMIGSKAIKDDESGLIETPALRSEKILPVAVVYGANASGKSYLVKALAGLKVLVRDSHRHLEPGAVIPLTPFLLDPAYAEKPITFRSDFVTGGVRYAYSFEATAKEFVKESLYAWRGGPRSMLFERIDGQYEFGRGLKGENRVIEKLTRPNSLYISAAIQNNHEQLTGIAEAIDSAYIEISTPSYRALLRKKKMAFDPKFLKFLAIADIGVVDVRLVEKKKDNELVNLLQKFASFMENEANSAFDSDVIQGFNEPEIKIELGHRAREGRTVFFDLEKESAGTVQRNCSPPAFVSAFGL